MPASQLSSLREAFDRSARHKPFPDRDAVEREFRPAWPIGVLDEHLHRRLRDILLSGSPTGYDTGDLRRAKRAFGYLAAIERAREWDAELAAVLAGMQAGSHLHPPGSPAWDEAADLARALVVLGVWQSPDVEMASVAAAAGRMVARGFRLGADDTGIVFQPGELERATATVQAHLDTLGCAGVLTNLFDMVRQSGNYGEGMYFPGRRLGIHRTSPSLPVGFLLNLAVRSPWLGVPAANPGPTWSEALETATDLVACLEVEPYSQFFAINVPPKRLAAFLQETGLFDHLFSFRQWPFEITATVLRAFFGALGGARFRAASGYDLDEVIRFVDAVGRLANTDPVFFRSTNLAAAGFDAETLSRLLTDFTHPHPTVNSAYTSPTAADTANLMFKPLVEVAPGILTPVARPLCGPAFYEAAQTLLRGHLSRQERDDLAGNGTEAVVRRLFEDVGLTPTFVAAKYEMGPDSHGECDLVFEDVEVILLVETKAKALTRATMAGAPAAALLDMAASTLSAQVQSQRHERILRTVGGIDFVDGRRLEWRNRRIVRLSATLLDLGALQDRTLFWQLISPLLRSSFAPEPGFRQAEQVSDLNATIEDARREATILAAAGIPVDEQHFSCASLNVGHLAVLLSGISGLAHFVRRAARPITMMTLNPLAEFVFLRAQKIVD